MNIEHLYMSFGLQEIFNDVSVHFNDDDKIGIVGVNGAGKSTLFNLILGNISPDSGKITVKNRDLIGYLPQVITDEIPNDDITVFEYLLLGRPIQKLKDNITSLYEQIAVEKDDKKLNYLFKKIYKNSQFTFFRFIFGKLYCIVCYKLQIWHHGKCTRLYMDGIAILHFICL